MKPSRSPPCWILTTDPNTPSVAWGPSPPRLYMKHPANRHNKSGMDETSRHFATQSSVDGTHRRPDTGLQATMFYTVEQHQITLHLRSGGTCPHYPQRGLQATVFCTVKQHEITLHLWTWVEARVFTTLNVGPPFSMLQAPHLKTVSVHRVHK